MVIAAEDMREVIPHELSFEEKLSKYPVVIGNDGLYISEPVSCKFVKFYAL